MQQGKVNLSLYDNSWYAPGRNIIARFLWYYVNAAFFNTHLFPLNALKVFLLRMFGGRVGNGVVIKPKVNIKYPWNLSIGSHAWIGEQVWIDNLARVTIGDHCCLSQGAMLLTGNHDYRKQTFDLIVKEIVLEEGAWIGAWAVVCPGVTCRTHSVLSVNSVAASDLEPYSIYQGNPALKTRERSIT